jgi:hypothetical protein
MKRMAGLVVALGMMASLRAVELGDILLAAPQVVKTSFGFSLVAGSLAEIGKADLVSIGAGVALGTALALPAGMTLLGAIRGDSSATSTWRRVALFGDAALALGALGLGIYSLMAPSSDPEGWDRLIGVTLIVVSVPLGAGAAIDTIPYTFERKPR